MHPIAMLVLSTVTDKKAKQQCSSTMAFLLRRENNLIVLSCSAHVYALYGLSECIDNNTKQEPLLRTVTRFISCSLFSWPLYV